MRLLAILVLISCASSAWAESRPPFIFILVPGLKAEDLTRSELQPLQPLTWQSAHGWMNSRTARVIDRSQLDSEGRPAIEAACLSINAGTRATARSSASRFDAGFLQRLNEDNQALDHAVPIGALGRLLHDANLKTAVLGNADDSQARDLGSVIAMDSDGRVDIIMSGSIARASDSSAPYGFRSNLAIFAKPVNADFQVWVFGDLWRAEQYAPLSLPEAARSHRAFALSRLAQVLDIATERAQAGNAAFLLLSPSPSPSASRLDKLSPVLRLGVGAQAGILFSPSTRTPGLIANTDILPTVAAYFGIKLPAGSIGRPVSAVTTEPENRTTVHWAEIHARWLLQSQKQSAFGGLPTLQLVLLLIALVATRWAGQSASDRLKGLAPAIAVSLLLLPAGQLLLPPLCPFEVWVCGLALSLVTLVIGTASLIYPGFARPAAITAIGGLAAALLVDLFAGEYLLSQAWMSYSVMEGARYYGIGNEYAGAALGALGSLPLLMRDRIPPSVHAGALIGFGLLCGFPGLGANAGAMLAFFVAGAAALASTRAAGRRAIFLAATLAAMLLIIALLVWLDAAASGGSHIGRASGGGIAGIITRKLALNWYLLFHSPWSLCLITAIAGLWWAYKVRHHTLQHSTAANSAPAAHSLGAAAMLVFNDSGVVAAANTLLVWWAAKTVSAHATDPLL